MSARVALPTLLIAACLTLSLGPAADPVRGPAASRAGAWSLSRGEYYSEVQAAMFSTLTSYDNGGVRIAFGRPGELEQRGLSWRNEIGWRKKTSLLLGITTVSVVGFEGPPLGPGFPQPVGVPGQSGMSEFDLGLHYKLKEGDRASAIELEWRAPAGYDRELSRALGDGRQEFAGALDLGSTLGSRGFIEISGGAAYRFHKLGSSDDAANMDPRMTTNVYYDLGSDLGFWLGHAVLIGGRFRGRMLGSTSGVGDPSNVHMVGPMQLVGDAQIDQNLQLLGPLFLFRLDPRIDVIAGSYSTAGGENTLHFDQFYLSLAFKQSKLKRNQGFMGSTTP